LQIRRGESDTIEEQNVTLSPGTYSTITTDAFSFTPSAYDVYAFGESNIVTKPFRIAQLSRDTKNEVTVSAVEYISAIYDDSAVTIPEDNYSALDLNAPDVENMRVDEENTILDDGTISSYVKVSWEIPDQSDYYLSRLDHVKVYMSNDGSTYYPVGEAAKGDTFYEVHESFLVGETYYFKAVVKTPEGKENPFDASPSGSVTIRGDALPPDDVTGFQVSQRNDTLRFSWDENTDKDLARYKIKKGSEWSTGTVIAEKVDVTEFEYPVGTIGEEVYMIKIVTGKP